MKTTFRLIAALMIAIVAAGSLGGCHTVKGAGKDIESAGKEIQKASDDVRK
jgi:predicted small secreted protein